MVNLTGWAWRDFATTYGLVFVMELLDNTQLIQVYYSSKYGKQWVLALASWLAFICTGLIGASFSGIRELSEYATKSIELGFTLLIFAMGVITLSHSEKVLHVWNKVTGFLQKKIADPFLYKMGEKATAEDDVSMDEKGLIEKGSKPAAEPAEDSSADIETGEEEKPKEALPSRQLNIEWWRLFILVFATVFVLELPDKTMLMIASLAQGSDFPLSIFVGYGCAMVSQSIIALVVGKGIATGAEKYGEWIEMSVGFILTITGTVKIAIMMFTGESVSAIVSSSFSSS